MTDRKVINHILETEFVDRYLEDGDRAVDVIIPLLNSNTLFEKCLINFFKSIPINRLIIGDGGCTDDSIEIAKKFPRVEIINHSEFKTLGNSLKHLIKEVSTKYLIYLHADVFLPDSWFDTMYSHRDEFSWYECGRKIVYVLAWNSDQYLKERAYSGSQFGNTKTLQKSVEAIEDDFLYRNEDIVIAELVGKENYHKFDDTFHYHQQISTRDENSAALEFEFQPPRIKSDRSRNWEINTFTMQWKGIVKYCDPKEYLVEHVLNSMKVLKKLNVFEKEEEIKWINDTNPQWNDILWKKRRKYQLLLNRIKNRINRYIRS